MEKTSGSEAASAAMFDIVCSVDHTPYGEPAGQVLARVRELGDTLTEYGESHPNCRLTAVAVDAPIGSQFGEPPALAVDQTTHTSRPAFEQPVRTVQPVYPLAR